MKSRIERTCCHFTEIRLLNSLIKVFCKAQKHIEFAAIQICDEMTSTDLMRELSRLCHVYHIYVSNIL